MFAKIFFLTANIEKKEKFKKIKSRKMVEENKDLYLAPMAGFTNRAFRQIVSELGADVVVSEFVHSDALVRNIEKIWKSIAFTKTSAKYGVQIFGSNPITMGEAAAMVEEKIAPDFIDLNFGCPAPAALNCDAGSALLKTPSKIIEIAKEVKRNLKNTPVSVKIRLGWDLNNIIASTLCESLANVGIKQITIHARTKTQGYSGQANWQEIEKVIDYLKEKNKDNNSVKIIGNGDIKDINSYKQNCQNSKCHAFMIGRAALKNPWIFKQIKQYRLEKSEQEIFLPTWQDRKELILKYIDLSLKYEKDTKVSHIKPPIMQMINNIENSKKIRDTIARAKSLEEIKNAFLS